MPHRYSTALSHLILGGTGIYCWNKHFSGSFTFPCITYGVILTNSVLGVWRWGLEDHGQKVDDPYNFTGFLQSILALPFVVTEVWLKSGYQAELAYLHSAVALLPLTMYLANKSSGDMIDLLAGANCISLGVVSFLNENYYGIAAAVSYLLNHFCLREGNIDLDMPTLDLFNYGMYSTALSHLILGGTGIYCWNNHFSGSFTFPCVTFGVILTNSVLGVWRWGIEDHGRKVNDPYNFTGFLQSILALPFVVTEVWLKSGYQVELAYLHSAVAFLPLTMYLAKKSSGDLIDLLAGANCISLGVVSYLNENYYGIAAAVSYYLNHFCLREGNIDLDMPTLDLFNYGMCFYCYFSLRAVK